MVASSHMLLLNHYVDVIAAIVSLIFNAILIVLILTKSPTQFGSYKYLMVFIAVFEMVMALQEAVLVPVHYSHGSAVAIMVIVSNTPFSQQTVLILLLISLGLVGASLSIFAVHFIYRYLVVSGSPLIKTFQSGKLIFWSLFPISSGLTWSVTGYFLLSPDQEVHDFLCSHVLRDFGVDIERFEYRLFYLYRRVDNGGVSFNLGSLSALGIYSSTVSFSLFIILFFGFKCYRYIRNLKNKSTRVSSQFNTIQHQLFYALVVQTIIPVIHVHVPTMFLFLLALFEVDAGIYVSIASMSVAFYCIIDPLPNFFIIKPYRAALSEYLMCRKSKEDDLLLQRVSVVTHL